MKSMRQGQVKRFWISGLQTYKFFEVERFHVDNFTLTKPIKLNIRIRKGERKMVSFVEYYESKYRQPVTAPG
jgi:hypothetical protein